MNRQNFFSSVRTSLFGDKLTDSQVQGMNAILDEWQKRKLCDQRQLAYILATVYHETGVVKSRVLVRTMQPVEETGKGAGKPYGVKDKVTGETYYGRGFVQLTWRANYAHMGKLLGIDLLTRPELALNIFNSTQILFEGMIRGSFTGKKLSDYFNEKESDYVNARRIINGTDKAELIAGYAKKFYAAIGS